MDDPKFNIGSWVFVEGNREGVVLSARPVDDKWLYVVETANAPMPELGIPITTSYGASFEDELTQRHE